MTWRTALPPEFSDAATPDEAIRRMADALTSLRKRLGSRESVPGGKRETSRAAAMSVEPTAGTTRRIVLDFIRSRGAHGATDSEIERALSMKHQTASARRYDLEAGGWVTDSGKRRKTDSGRDAIVWVAVTPMKGGNDCPPLDRAQPLTLF